MMKLFGKKVSGVHVVIALLVVAVAFLLMQYGGLTKTAAFRNPLSNPHPFSPILKDPQCVKNATEAYSKDIEAESKRFRERQSELDRNLMKIGKNPSRMDLQTHLTESANNISTHTTTIDAINSTLSAAIAAC